MPIYKADAEDYIDADESGPHDDMAPVDIRAVLTEAGDVGYAIVESRVEIGYEAS
jgi:hypothetical protein